MFGNQAHSVRNIRKKSKMKNLVKVYQSAWGSSPQVSCGENFMSMYQNEGLKLTKCQFGARAVFVDFTVGICEPQIQQLLNTPGPHMACTRSIVSRDKSWHVARSSWHMRSSEPCCTCGQSPPNIQAVTSRQTPSSRRRALLTRRYRSQEIEAFG